ncbi:MAG: hypothetical protein V3T15_01635, partial [Pseudomonadales bacterium]
MPNFAYLMLMFGKLRIFTRIAADELAVMFRAKRKIGVVKRRCVRQRNHSFARRGLENADIVRIAHQRREPTRPGEHNLLNHELDVDNSPEPDFQIRLRAALLV